MKYGEVSYGFEVFVDDEYFSSGSGSDWEQVKAEAAHYAFVTVGEGVLSVKFYERREILEPDA